MWPFWYFFTLFYRIKVDLAIYKERWILVTITIPQPISPQNRLGLKCPEKSKKILNNPQEFIKVTVTKMSAIQSTK